MPTPTPAWIFFARGMLLLALLLALPAARAVRPMTVDDANVDAYGQGHVDGWFGHGPGGAQAWNLVPDWVPAQDSEVDLLLSHDTAVGVNGAGLQFKRLFSPAQVQGCNAGAGLAWTQFSAGQGGMPQLNGILTCNVGARALHLNGGALRVQGRTRATWGLAAEQGLGAWSVNAEVFGQQGAKPAFQIGARSLQGRCLLNTAVGRSGGLVIWSLGLALTY